MKENTQRPHSNCIKRQRLLNVIKCLLPGGANADSVQKVSLEKTWCWPDEYVVWTQSNAMEPFCV